VSRLVYVAVGAIVVIELAREQIAKKVAEELAKKAGDTPEVRRAARAAGDAFASRLGAASIGRIVIEQITG